MHLLRLWSLLCVAALSLNGCTDATSAGTGATRQHEVDRDAGSVLPKELEAWVPAFAPDKRQEPPPPTSIDLIEAALDEGTLDEEQALLYEVYAVFGDDRLPPQFAVEPIAGPSGSFDGDWVMRSVVSRFASLSTKTQAKLDPFLRTPLDPASWFARRLPRAAAIESDAGREQDSTSDAGLPSIAMGAALRLQGAAPQEFPEPTWKSVDESWYRVWYLVLPEMSRDEVAKLEGSASRVAAALDRAGSKLNRVMGVAKLKSDADLKGGNDFVQNRPKPEDGRLDVYLVDFAKGESGGDQMFGLTVGYTDTPCQDGVASFILINREKAAGPAPLVDFMLAHEYMHVLQTTLPHAQSCEVYSVLDEATAHWATTLFPLNYKCKLLLPSIYPFFTVSLWEGFGAQKALRKVTSEAYGSWPFYYQMTLEHGNSIIADVYTAAAVSGPWDALDQAVPGGLASNAQKYLATSWNMAPLADKDLKLREWTCLPGEVFRSASGDPFYSRDSSMALPKGKLKKDLETRIATGGAEKFFEFTNIEASNVAFTLSLSAGEASAVRVQAFVKRRGKEVTIEDWTNRKRVEFCRLRKDQDIEHVVIGIVNAFPSSDSHYSIDATLSVETSEECSVGTFTFSWVRTEHCTEKGMFEETAYETNASCSGSGHFKVSGPGSPNGGLEVTDVADSLCSGTETKTYERTGYGGCDVTSVRETTTKGSVSERLIYPGSLRFDGDRYTLSFDDPLLETTIDSPWTQTTEQTGDGCDWEGSRTTSGSDPVTPWTGTGPTPELSFEQALTEGGLSGSRSATATRDCYVDDGDEVEGEISTTLNVTWEVPF